jgi:hypothetical protein
MSSTDVNYHSALAVASEVLMARRNARSRNLSFDKELPASLVMSELPDGDNILINAMKIEAELIALKQPKVMTKSKYRIDHHLDPDSHPSGSNKRRKKARVDMEDADIDIENFVNSNSEREVMNGVNIVKEGIKRPACAARGLGPNDHGGLTFKRTKDIVREGIRGQTKLMWAD